jgi:hypothetical protein
VQKNDQIWSHFMCKLVAKSGNPASQIHRRSIVLTISVQKLAITIYQ